MARRKSLAWTELRVGILVIASFVLLAVAIFYVSGQSGFLTPKYRITGYFSSASGLRPGAEVWLEGIDVGSVEKVEIQAQSDPNKSVAVVMRLDTSYKNIIRSDSKILIQTTGLLGDEHVDIARGSAAGKVIEDGGFLQGQDAGDIKKIITGTNDIIANVDLLSEQVKRMAENLDQGKGTIGKFMNDPAIFDNTNKILLEANALVHDARTGDGTIGKLMHDDELYQKFNGTMDRLNKMVDYVEAGNGTIGKIYKDPSLYNRADGLIGRFQTIADNIDQGKGTLGKFMKDDALYNDFVQTMQHTNSLIGAIQNGQGTIGKAINDPTLYNSLNQTSSEILKLLYDFRQNPKKFLTINFKLF